MNRTSILILLQLAVILILPTVAAFGLPALLGHSVIDSLPVAISDEFIYWHQAVSFAEVGFDAGYYSSHERPAPADFTPYYAWGPWTPAYYGAWFAVLGRNPAGIPIVNTITLTLAFAAFLVITRPSSPQLGLLVLGVVTFAPLWIYASSSFVEPIHMALAVIIAGLVWRRFRAVPPSNSQRAMTFVLLLTISVAALLRVSWALLFVPVLTLTFGPRRRGRIAGFAIGCACILSALFASRLFSAPYQGFHADLSSKMLTDTVQFAAQTAALFFANLMLLLNTHIPEIILVGSALTALVLASRGWRTPATGNGSRAILWIAYANIGLMLFFMFATYRVDDWHAFRLLGNHLLLNVVLFALAEKRRAVFVTALLLTVAAALALPKLASDLEKRAAQPDSSSVLMDRASLSVLDYESQIKNRWCNTLTVSVDRLSPPNLPALMVVPAGFGISVIQMPDTMARLRAKYVFISDAVRDEFRFELDLIPLAIGNGGTLYLNRDSECSVPDPRD